MIADLKHYPTMKDSGVEWLREVPAHWEVRRLKDTVVGCVNGVWGSDPNGSDDLPCVRVADFDRGSLRVKHSVQTLRAISQSERQRRTLSSGDLLLEKSGGGERQPVGTVVLFDHEAPAVCSNFVARMPVREGYSSHFLTYLHSTLYAKGLNKRSIKQTTGIQNLDSSAYLSEFAGLPPLPEQAAIVRYLDHVDRRVRRLTRAKRKLIALLTEQKQAIIHRAVTRGLDPDVALKDSGVEWLGEVPEHWGVVPLRYLGTKFGSGVTPKGGATVYQHTGIPLIRSQNVHFSGLRLDGVARISRDLHEQQSGSHVRPGDVLLNITGASLGRVCSVPDDFVEGNVNQHVCIIRPQKLKITPRYLSSFLSTPKIQMLIQFEQTGAAREGLTLDSIRSFKVPLPSPEEQVAIIEHLQVATANIDTTITRAEREIELLTEYRTRLIADVVTGKLDVRDAAAALPEVDPLAEDDSADDLDAGLALDADELDEAAEEAEA